MTFWPTASQLGRAFSCTYPWASGLRWRRGEESDPLRYGNALHRVGELHASGRPVDPLALADAHKLSASDTKRIKLAAAHLVKWIDSLGATAKRTEVPFAYHVPSDTARILVQAKDPTTGEPNHRDYSDRRRGEITGTADLVVTSGILVVYDYKSGRPDNVEAIEANRQMRALGLMSARAFKREEVRISLVYVGDDGVFEDAQKLDDFALDGVASEIATLTAKLSAPSVPVTGAHCKWCPIQAECPATQRALAAVNGASELRFPMSVEIASPEHAVYVRHRLKVVREACDAIDAAVKDYVRANGPIDVGDGVVYGLREQTRETIEIGRPGAYEALARHLGDKVNDAVELSTTKAQIKAAIASTSTARGEATKRERALLDELRGIGSIRETKYERFDEFEPKEKAS